MNMNFESLVKSITEIFSEEPDKPFKNDTVSNVLTNSPNKNRFDLLMKNHNNTLGQS